MKLLAKNHSPRSQGARLSDNDLNTLLFLANQRLLKTQQLYMYRKALEPNTKEKSFSEKIRRWRKDYQLIKDYEYTLGIDGFRYKYYRITRKGIDTLIQHGLLPSSWDDVQISKFSSITNIDHFLGTQEVVIRAIVENISIEIESLVPTQYVYTDIENPDLTLVKPDWILKLGNLHLNIEFDTGNENLSVIKDKVQRYIKYSKQNPNERHVVFLTIIDDSFRTRKNYGSVRNKRVGNMKNTLFYLNDLHIQNLTVFILPLQRVHNVLNNVILGLQPYSERMKRLEPNTVFTLLGEHNNYFGYSVKKLPLHSVYEKSSIKHEYYADFAACISNKSGTVKENVLAVLAEEGNAQTLEKINNLSRLALENRFDVPVGKILVLYKESHQRVNDILSIVAPNVLIGDIEELKKNLNKEPVFYIKSGLYTAMKGVTYEGQLHSYA
ncbi:replication-relaxation family protein (plasmid) [Metabacillus halosaccharovorans]|uniref:replication-relaxation family protein n=3 Tax=Metabacillus halosaccharovorans TaxID=930124 RepID=UPI002041D881|nr:replication-relaxation family protein [Metabacillus halosaccharovorans]MCM3441367.1 replication-relaxation family protein [Metabacillus halosaccharovorans]